METRAGKSAYQMMCEWLQSSRADLASYRFSPSELDLMVDGIVARVAPMTERRRGVYSLVDLNRNKVAVFKMHKDAADDRNTPNLKQFLQGLRDYYDQEGRAAHDILYIPIFTCRGTLKAPIHLQINILSLIQFAPFAWLQRQHAMLLEINLAQRKIIVHDAQHKDGWRHYPDKFQETLFELEQLFGMTLQYEQGAGSYGIQTDDYSCGAYVACFLEKLLHGGTEADLKKIHLELKQTYLNKCDFAKRHFEVDIPLQENSYDSSKSILDAIPEELFDLSASEDDVMSEWCVLQEGESKSERLTGSSLLWRSSSQILNPDGVSELLTFSFFAADNDGGVGSIKVSTESSFHHDNSVNNSGCSPLNKSK